VRERYLGLELSGAKNNKTALSILEYYPKEKKVFLLDIQDRISVPRLNENELSLSHSGSTADEFLLKLLRDTAEDLAVMAVNVPLTLPPCFLSGSLEKQAILWMQRFSRKIAKERKLGRLEFTPYTQRPVELWIRHQLIAALTKSIQFDVDEALGGNRAPLTARMHYLERRLDQKNLIEAWPKLSALRLCLQLGIDRRFLTRYRKLEEGAHARQIFLEQLVALRGIFIYERDLRKLSASLTAFDSFICAYTALLFRLGECEKPPKGFPVKSGWVYFPREL
jgi:hypothetical protein